MANRVEIVDYRVIRLSHKTRGHQYAVKVVLSDGSVIYLRLSGMFPSDGITKFEDESEEFRARGNLEIIRATHKYFTEGPRPAAGCKFKTFRAAMEAFEIEQNRDHHGNAAKEFFKEMPITEAVLKVHEFVDWLMEKYSGNQQTVSKKVFAASAMFKWLKRKGQWHRPNPFHGALDGLRFSARNKCKSIIKPEEYQRLKEVMQKEQFKELRIITGIMFYTGLRPSEAMELKWEQIDSEMLTLTYQRTKRKNKQPDWRRIPIPGQLIAFLRNEGRTDGQLVRVGKTGLTKQMRKARYDAQIGGLTLKTWRKDFSYRARLIGASRDDLNLFQGRDEGVLEKFYTNDEWFIVHQCRPWIEKMFDERKTLTRIK